MVVRVISGVLLSSMLWLVCGCGTLTEIDGSWTNPDYASKSMKKVVVFCVGAQTFLASATMETAVADKLARTGTEAIAATNLSAGKSYDADNDGVLDSEYSKEVLVPKLRTEGYDGVLVLTVKSVTSKERFVAGTTVYQPAAFYGKSGWYNHWSENYLAVQTPGYTATDVTAVLEANLYTMDKDVLVWGARTTLYNPSSVQDAAESVASTIVPAMKKAGVVGGR